ncbi:MAG TPA: PKD domain-containing protein [Flavisolibacter sp.]|nr:PKD domain-containing protein [Flavisolibacter sp.]
MNALAKHHRRSLALFFLLCCHAAAFGQLRADFTATPVSGCSPLIVNFTDQSTGSPLQWRWELGNGVVSTLKNPSATYFNPGTYSVKLTVRNAAGADSIVKQQLITVYAQPSLAFTASDTSGCFPLPVQFSHQGSAGSGSISTWQWDFGDGNLSSLQHPSHVYAGSGNYTVTLKVVNSYGCTRSLSKPQYIKVSQGVKAGFTNTAAGPCAAPAIVQFSNTSTGPGVLSYSWNFGDGHTSQEANPIHTYSANGSYSVSLTAISAQGCRDTVLKTNLLNIGAIQSGFSLPDTLCTGRSYSLRNTSSPMPADFTWNFGDGSTSTASEPVKQYAGTGVYTIKLVNDFGACQDSVSRQVTVIRPPQADFSVNATSFCQLPATAQFQPTVAGAVSFFWHFGDGTTSTAVNPVHTYTSEGKFSVTLIVTNAAGCSDTITKQDLITIKKPVIQVSGLPRNGCTPLTIAPLVNITSDQAVQSYHWNFGDGHTSTAISPSHTYSRTGTYTVSLVITTVNGCKDSIVLPGAVRAGEKPTAYFSLQPNDFCALANVGFTDQSSGPVDRWLWFFGDGDSSTLQHPHHQYGDTGWLDVKLIVWNNTCPDTLLVEDAIHIRPPIARIIVNRSCDEPYTRRFESWSTGARAWHWDFGDGNSSTAEAPVHTYAPGTYTATMTVFNGDCATFARDTVRVINEKAAIEAEDTIICKNRATRFRAPGINAEQIFSWHWSFGDGTVSNQPSSVSHSYAATGNYTVRLIITDLNKCSDTAFMQVTVLGPTAYFSSSAQAACLLNNQINFFDSSQAGGVNSIVNWTWSYGDGHTQSASSAQSHHSYTQPGVYDISLIVTDAHGCTDQMSKPASLVIAQPLARFQALDSLSCTGQAVAFTNSSVASGPQYQWAFGDGASASSVHPSHAYQQVGVYSVSLRVTDQYGCRDSLTRPSYIHISLPKARFAMSDSFSTCPPLLVNFTNQSAGYTGLRWDFGDGSFSNLADPSHFYNTPGEYNAKLIATGPGGCTDTLTRRIVVKGPKGSFAYGSLKGCNPLTVQFAAVSQDATSFVWDFGDGTTLPGTGQAVAHTYSTPGDFVPKLVLIDAGGCHVSLTGKDTISVFSAKADFEINASRFCTAGTVSFTNTSLSNDYITAYEWRFGDGGTSSESNPAHYYDSVGFYRVSLVATTMHGCSDTLVLSDTIKVLRAPSITIAGDSAACMPASFGLTAVASANAEAVTQWRWKAGSDELPFTGQAATQQYTNAGQYSISVIATAANGCQDTAYRLLTVHALPEINAGPDQAICRGSVAQLTATGAASYVWDQSAALSCSECPAPLAAPGVSHTYTVTGISPFGCTKKDSVLVTVRQPFRMETAKGDTICAGSTVTLSAWGADLYSWLPSVGVQDPSAASTVARPVASTTYRVVGRDRHNCFTDTASVYIKVWPIPKVDAGADITLAAGESTQLKPVCSPDVSKWQWSNGASLDCYNCPSPVARPRQTTTYAVQVKNEGGCSARDELTIFVVCGNGNLFIPNTFSPNNDGTNDRFYPSGKGIHLIKSMKVFNRWGEVVFERSGFNANDAASGWDGSFKGQILAPDVYIYTCEVVCLNNEVLTFKGDVTLLR